MKNLKITLSCLIMVIASTLATAQADESATDWYTTRGLADPDRPYLYYPDEKTKQAKDQQLPQTPEQGQAALAQLQESLKLSRALAIMNPTPDNIKDYIAKQEVAMNKSSAFADQWRRTLWEHPEMDYSQTHRPTTQAAIQMYDQNKDDSTRNTIKWVAENQGLVFFVRSDCKYCHAFAPILKQFQQQYGMRVMTISLDGVGIPGYEDALPDNGIAAKLGVTVTPMIFIADSQNKQYIPLGAGFLSLTELENRFAVVYSKVGEQF